VLFALCHTAESCYQWQLSGNAVAAHHLWDQNPSLRQRQFTPRSLCGSEQPSEQLGSFLYAMVLSAGQFYPQARIVVDTFIWLGIAFYETYRHSAQPAGTGD